MALFLHAQCLCLPSWREGLSSIMKLWGKRVHWKVISKSSHWCEADTVFSTTWVRRLWHAEIWWFAQGRLQQSWEKTQRSLARLNSSPGIQPGQNSVGLESHLNEGGLTIVSYWWETGCDLGRHRFITSHEQHPLTGLPKLSLPVGTPKKGGRCVLYKSGWIWPQVLSLPDLWLDNGSILLPCCWDSG